MASVLSLQNLQKSYFIQNREIPILKGISLEIERGECLAIMGPSGSGKSTLLHIMGGLDTPTAGNVFINEKEVTNYNDDALAQLRNRTLGFVFQSFFLLNYYTALENVCLPLIYAGLRHKKEGFAKQLLAQVGLGQRMHHHPQEMSGGERQRVAIARALVNQPLILFADEPTGNLDTKTGQTILGLLKEINKKGTTVVIITHDPQIARYADRTIQIQDGLLL